MKTAFDCLACMVRQSLDAIRMVTDDEKAHERFLRDMLAAMSQMDLCQTPPAMAQQIHRKVRALSGQPDPYKAIKHRFNQLALSLYPKLKKIITKSDNRLETALRLAIAGNIIDFGVHGQLTDQQVHDALEIALTSPIEGSVETFRQSLDNAQTVLYLADNAGEIVLDRLLVEELLTQGKQVTLGVRGSAILNDVTHQDAEFVGLAELVEVIDNGSDAPGTILDDCSESFQKRFWQADLVIAKGQGNYETLSDIERNIFFVLKVKCPVIGNDMGCSVGSHVVRQGNVNAKQLKGRAV